MSDQPETRIVVELVQSADVKRLEASDEAICDRIKSLEARVDALHRTIYDLMSLFGRKK